MCEKSGRIKPAQGRRSDGARKIPRVPSLTYHLRPLVQSWNSGKYPLIEHEYDAIVV